VPVKLGFIILSIIGVLRIPEEFYLYKDKRQRVGYLSLIMSFLATSTYRWQYNPTWLPFGRSKWVKQNIQPAHLESNLDLNEDLNEGLLPVLGALLRSIMGRLCLGQTCRLNLHSDRDSIPDVPAVYFVLPTDDNIR
jgi:hypothetical protein